tara:strand:+ start:1250 stop:2005 length:756 start_codon:yes stop_codon:yes gene_type:complete
MSNNQSKHYDKIANKYIEHYFDKESKYYKSKLYMHHIFKHFNKDDYILEIGCSDGSNLEIFKENGINIENYFGVEISEELIKKFNKKYKNQYKVFHDDFTKKDLNLNIKFNIIVCIGVLHHMNKNLDTLFNNVKNHLKKNGKIIILEPNKNFLNFLRNYWYKKDKYFDHTSERALSINEIDNFAKNGFEKIFTEYSGLIGYFVILQSLILRTPKFVKKVSYKLLTYIDYFLSKFNLKYLSAHYLVVYKKID